MTRCGQKNGPLAGTDDANGPGGTFRLPARFGSGRTLGALGALDCARYRAVAEL